MTASLVFLETRTELQPTAMADKLKIGVCSPAVKKLQQMINAAYQGSVVAETGTFDEDTAAALAKFQATAGLPQTGAADAETLKALSWAAIPKRSVNYKGQTYVVTESEYKQISAKLVQKLSGPVQAYGNMAAEVRSLWNAHNEARKNHAVFAAIVDVAAGSSFPSEGKITAAEAAAARMKSAAAGGDINALKSAMDDGSAPIREAMAAMSQYRDELYGGGAELIRNLETIRDGCVVVLEISAAVATGGSSMGVTAAVMGGVGGYKALLGEIDKASTSSKVDLGAAFGNILLSAAIEAGAGALMKGKFVENVAKAAAAKVSGAALKKVGSEAIAAFAGRAIEGGGKKAFEELVKDLCKACNPNDKMTLQQAAENVAANFVKGALFQQLDGVLSAFGKGVSKHFSAGDFKGLGKVDYNKALKEGGQKALELAYDKWAPAAIKASDGNPQKVESELKSLIVKDAGVQKWFADYGKKNAK